MSIQVDIYGIKYNLKGSSDREHIEKIARFVDRRMQEIGGMDPRLTNDKIAVLSAVNIADELFKVYDELRKVKEEYSKLISLLEEEAQEITKKA
ncbi:MAG: cell division protein ZapA [Bacilli bacterium]|nr:cell division protein ZapA [Bacilli bacterium]